MRVHATFFLASLAGEVLDPLQAAPHHSIYIHVVGRLRYQLQTIRKSCQRSQEVNWMKGSSVGSKPMTMPNEMAIRASTLDSFTLPTLSIDGTFGPNQEYYARGRQDICDVALGYWMDGFEEWKYPYHDVIIDEQRGTVICFYKQVAPNMREDGTPCEVAAISGSWLEYAGNYQWKCGNKISLTLGMSSHSFLSLREQDSCNRQSSKRFMTKLVEYSCLEWNDFDRNRVCVLSQWQVS